MLNKLWAVGKMDFLLDDEQLAIKEMARDFVNEEIIPVARLYDEEERFPEELDATS